jgi:hypothetical protein
MQKLFDKVKSVFELETTYIVGQLPSPVALSNSAVVANGANASRKRIRRRGS